jgi:hypothetical protein
MSNEAVFCLKIKGKQKHLEEQKAERICHEFLHQKRNDTVCIFIEIIEECREW